MRVKHRFAVLIGAAIFGFSAGAGAAPNLYWHHVHSGGSQDECLSKAEGVMLSDKAGRIVKDGDSVRSWSDKTVGIVECLKLDNGLFAMILVASDDAQEASILQSKLEKAIAGK